MSIFNKINSRKVKRNFFKLDHDAPGTCASGKIVPIMAMETIPGDIFVGATGLELRTQPLVAPLMHRINVDIRYFYVPNRLLWDNFGEFLMDQEQGVAKVGLKSPHVHPYLQASADDNYAGFEPGTVYDYFGVPQQCGEPVNALPFRAYNLIWNEYFRDQNLQDDMVVSKLDGKDDLDSYRLLNVGWKKDYFTSALPWTQRGQDVSIHNLVTLVDQGWNPSQSPEIGDVRSQKVLDAKEPDVVTPLGSNNAFWLLRPGISQGGIDPSVDGDLYFTHGDNAAIAQQGVSPGLIDPNGTWEVNTSILELRKSSAVQRFLERSALVGGARYADWLRGIYGVNVGDGTLQRPMYLGGGSTPINISPIEQNSSSDNVSPQGNLAGKGYVLRGFHFKKTVFAEHGWIIGLLFIRPEAVYQNNLSRHLSKQNRFDYFIPGFENIGEQEILNKEVYCVPGSAIAASTKNNGTFGYQSRYSEYKFEASTVHGEMKTNLSKYVMPRVLGSGYPSQTSPIPLNGSFITCNPNEDNNFAVAANVADHYIYHVFNQVRALRPLQYFPNYSLG